MHQPPPLVSSFLCRRVDDGGVVSGGGRLEEELARLRSPAAVPRVEEVNQCLAAMVRAGKDEQVLSLIPKMEIEFGVAPNEATESLVAEIAIKRAKPQEALKLLDARAKLASPTEDLLFGDLVMAALEKDLQQGLQVYERYVAKCTCPSPAVVSAAILACARQGHVERGFRIYREAKEGKCMLPTTITQCALLQAAAQSKAYYQEAVCAFRQMVAMQMPLRKADYCNLMLATSKVGDMHTALCIYQRCKDSGLVSPNLAAYLFFALAATESTSLKTSHRLYATKLTRREIVAAAKEAFAEVQSAATEKVLAAYLACMYVQREPAEAERVFYSELPRHGPRHVDSVENMLRMYDSLHSVPGVERVLKEVVDVEKTALTRRSYRAVVRTYAYAAQYDLAIEWMRRMRSAGFVPTMKELDILYMRLCQSDSGDLKQQFTDIVAPHPAGPRNPFLAWRLRSLRIAETMKEAYGPNAPKSATKRVAYEGTPNY